VGPGDYGLQPDCKWLISAPNTANQVGTIRLSFTAFHTSKDYVYVIIRRCTEPSCGGCWESELHGVMDHFCPTNSPTKQMALLTGNTSNVDLINEYTSSTGYLQVMFYSTVAWSHPAVLSAGQFTATWHWHPSLNCTACPAGTYKPVAGSAACAACAGNSTSPPSSTDVTACVCNAGFGGPPGGPCALCAAGEYALLVFPNSSCSPCPANSESAPPAAGPAACR
jgi:hypothetical protein